MIAVSCLSQAKDNIVRTPIGILCKAIIGTLIVKVEVYFPGPCVGSIWCRKFDPCWGHEIESVLCSYIHQFCPTIAPYIYHSGMVNKRKGSRFPQSLRAPPVVAFVLAALQNCNDTETIVAVMDAGFVVKAIRRPADPRVGVPTAAAHQAVRTGFRLPGAAVIWRTNI